MSIAISAPVAEALRKAAGDKDIEEFLVELLSARLDPPERVQLYLKLHEKYLREAEDLYARGDLLQAGEKYWGAATALLNAIAERRGWEHYSHRDYNVIIRRLYEETGDKELVIGFRMAEGLHANFYHNYMGPKDFQLHREAALKLIEKLKSLL
ncbi:PaREP1 family protein [Pyrobaculum aerophilum]|uniref:PaREP8 n=2 Tax=Pyrobaculum aerophilum TaxID=13773 RepID=Q8ZY87_PYRAE|nr:PaREP1 family protein [Pyrobaculum aerophilum]AAL63109.1 paREP8 [Pyrobaculum aerophilum str. IM2]MCX8135521.1 PaREP1 family protein [Pyrobaculum aerophilum]HII48125.1 PaREP1/PaREP8 domain-contain protein [Pyrobaculum aerophilum]